MKYFLPCLLIFACGCFGPDQYSLEKEYWRLGKLSERICSNPDAAPSTEVERVARLFADFSERHAGTPLASEAGFSIARLYMLKGSPEKARQQLEKVIAGCDLPEIKAEAYFTIGLTYQDEDWEKAQACYSQVVKDYPVTKRGVGIPLYIAEYYRDHFMPEKMVAAYNEAIGHYGGLAQKYPGTQLALEVRLMTASCYCGLKEWRNAVKVLEELASDFRSRMEMDGVLMNIALLYKNDLRDMGGFREALGRLIREYPESPLANTARGLLKSAGTDNGARN